MSCFKSKGSYEATRGLQPHIAGLIVEIQTEPMGLARIKYEWIPFYVPKKNDF